MCHSLANHPSPEIIPFSDVHHLGGFGPVPRMNSYTRMTPRALFHTGCFHPKTLFLRFIPDAVTRLVPPSLFTDEYYSIVCSCRNLSICSLVGRHLGCFQAEASMRQLARTLLATSLYNRCVRRPSLDYTQWGGWVKEQVCASFHETLLNNLPEGLSHFLLPSQVPSAFLDCHPSAPTPSSPQNCPHNPTHICGLDEPPLWPVTSNHSHSWYPCPCVIPSPGFRDLLLTDRRQQRRRDVTSAVVLIKDTSTTWPEGSFLPVWTVHSHDDVSSPFWRSPLGQEPRRVSSQGGTDPC